MARLSSRDLEKGDHVRLFVGPPEGTPVTKENVHLGGQGTVQGRVIANRNTHLHLVEDHAEDGDPTSLRHDNIRNVYRLGDTFHDRRSI